MLAALRALAPYLLRYKRRYVRGMLALVLRGVLATALPYVLGNAIDALADNEVDLARQLALLLLALAAAKGLAQYAMRWILITISRDIEYDLRSDLTGHLVHLDGAFYQRYRVGDLMARATNDLAQVRSLLGPGLMYTAEISVVFVAVMAVMAWTDWALTAMIFLPMPFISVAVSYFGRRTHDQFAKVQAEFSGMSAKVQEHISVLRMLRAYNQEINEQERFGESSQGYMDASMGLVRIWRTFYPALEFLVGAAGVAVLGFGGWRVLQGDLTVGTFTMFLYFLAMLTWPMIGLGVVVNITQRGVAALGRLNELHSFHPDIEGKSSTTERTEPAHGAVEWRSVTVRHPGASVPALTDVSLTLPAGGSLALIGTVGSGKSTLARLVPRLLNPTEGTVLVDGVDVREMSLEDLRGRIGFVPQETFLFSRTIAANIRLGRPDADDAAVRAVSDAAALDREEDAFPDGLQTVIGERGITLSGGQKQRTAIARALLVDPALLILDDATSSVDASTEADIWRHLRDGRRTRSVLIITNRVSSAMLADHVAVLDRGRVVEYGTHSELVDGGGLYTRMQSRQRIEQELAEL